MSGTTQDGRVWAVQVRDGRKVRVHPSLIASFPTKFKDLPSARGKAAEGDKPVAEVKTKAADTINPKKEA